MIETTRLLIKDRQLRDIPTEEFYMSLHPEIRDLDPTVGESNSPVFYSVFTKEDGKHIGMCCLYNFTIHETEVGVRIFIPEYWSKGYGGEVVNALCEYVFTCFSPINTIKAKTPVYNRRAIRCYEKCGFVRHSEAPLDGYQMIFLERRR